MVRKIAAILFVDDCDLLHMALCGMISLVQFLVKVQEELYFWARLLQVTGGDLKLAKLFWYLIAFKFVRGVPVMPCAGCPIYQSSSFTLFPNMLGLTWP